MQEYVGKVVSMVTMVGDMIGKIEEISDQGVIKIKNPRLFLQTDTGNTIAPGVSGTSVEYPECTYFSIHQILTFAEANENITNVWEQSVPETSLVSLNRGRRIGTPDEQQANTPRKTVVKKKNPIKPAAPVARKKSDEG